MILKIWEMHIGNQHHVTKYGAHCCCWDFLSCSLSIFPMPRLFAILAALPSLPIYFGDDYFPFFPSAFPITSSVAQLVLGLKPHTPFGQSVGCHTIKGDWFFVLQWLSNGSSSSTGGGILHLPSSIRWLCLAKSRAGLLCSAQLLWDHVCTFLASRKYCFLDIGNYLWLL